MNTIDSSLAEISLALILYQILFILKGCLFASGKAILLLKLHQSHMIEVRGSKQQSSAIAFMGH